MAKKLLYGIALAALLAPACGATRADDSQKLVQQYLTEAGVRGGYYPVTAVTSDAIAFHFPGLEFFRVTFIQYPIAFLVPEGFAPSNLFVVDSRGETALVYYLTNSDEELRAFFFNELYPVANEDEAKDAAKAWLTLSQQFQQDGFFGFGDPAADYTPVKTGAVVRGQVRVDRGGRGGIRVLMDFNEFGVLNEVIEHARVVPGVRPICQATKLLDADPLVRRMAEQDLLVMGKTAKPYLDEQRAKAKDKPELQEAIDKIWKRILEDDK